MRAKRFFEILSEDLARYAPGVTTGFGPRASHDRSHAAYSVTVTPGRIAEAAPVFVGTQISAWTTTLVVTVRAFDVEALDYLTQFEECERLCELVHQIASRLKSAVRFVGGQALGADQSAQIGAGIALNFTVLHGVDDQVFPGYSPAGAVDYREDVITETEITTEGTR